MLEVEGLGTLTVDTAYGGDSFVIVDAPTLGFAITPDEARELAETGMKITRAADEQLGFTHPENPDWSHFSFCQIAAPVQRGVDGVLSAANAVAIRPGKIDRSPTGHRLLGADGGAACQGAASGGGGVRREVDHRVAVRLPDRGGDDGWRAAGDRAGDLREGVDYGDAPAHAGPGRSLAGGVSAERYVAAARGVNVGRR